MPQALTTRRLDLWLLAGVPLLCFAGPRLAAAVGWGVVLPAGWAVALSLALSFPHFMASYAVFYASPTMRAEHRIAGGWLPLGLAGLLALIVWQGATSALQALGHGTLMLLYWHYLKQAFGAAIWLGGPGGPGGPGGRDPARGLRHLLRLTCLLLGSTGFLGLYRTDGAMQAFGLYLPMTSLPEELLSGLRWISVAVTAALVGAQVGAYVRRRDGAPLPPHPRGLLPVLALWTWVDPLFDGSPARAILPVFHGLQYLGFPLRVLYNEARTAAGPAARLGPRLVATVLGLVGGGYLAMSWLPGFAASLAPPAIAAELAAAVGLFFNLHHYAMDSVLWRFSDPYVRARLRGDS